HVCATRAGQTRHPWRKDVWQQTESRSHSCRRAHERNHDTGDDAKDADVAGLTATSISGRAKFVSAHKRRPFRRLNLLPSPFPARDKECSHQLEASTRWLPAASNRARRADSPITIGWYRLAPRECPTIQPGQRATSIAIP